MSWRSRQTMHACPELYTYMPYKRRTRKKQWPSVKKLWSQFDFPTAWAAPIIRTCDQKQLIIFLELLYTCMQPHAVEIYPLYLMLTIYQLHRGTVLSHQRNGSDKPITFCLSCIYACHHRKEVCTVRQWSIGNCFGVKHFLSGHTFTVHSEHNPLRHLFGEHKTTPTMTSSRILFRDGHSDKIQCSC